MAASELVDLAKIQFDPETQPRVQMNLLVVSEYAQEMQGGAQFPPVSLFFDGEHYWIGDGFHRCQAARQAGAAQIAAVVTPGEKRDAILASCAANAVHGLRRTNEDKGRAVDRMLTDPDWTRWTDSEIARHCGVSAMTVGNHRAKLSLKSLEIDSRFVTRGGTTYEMNTANIGVRPPVGQGLDEEALQVAATQTDLLHNQKQLERVARMPADLQLPILDKVAGGENVGTAVRQVLAEHRAENTTLSELPGDRYRCIVIDPPWPVDKIEREERPNQAAALDYETMPLEAIGLLPIEDMAAEDGCHLYLWVTQKFLPAGLAITEQWGFRYQCILTWVKPTGMTPFSWMYNTEHVIFAKSGSLPLQALGRKLSFEAPVTGHSEKPAAFFALVAECSPGPRIEMFARLPHDGFVAWGNEVVACG